MRMLHGARRAFSLSTAAAVLGGCGLTQAPLNPSISLQPRQIAYQHHASAHDLLYSGVKRYVEVYTFPSGSLEETFAIKGSINGMCSDSNGNVFIAAAPPRASTNGNGFVLEYSHGGKAPVATLDLPKNDLPIACSSDPTTGNLAVTAQNNRNFAPSVAIFARAGGTPTIYRSQAIGADPQAGYDDSGNLFVTSGGNVGAELPTGQAALHKITLAQTLGGVDHVQWDGTYWALQSFHASKHNGEKLFERIYRVQISGSSGKVVKVVSFDGWPEKDAGQSWIQSGTIVATPFSHIEFWAYPAGGEAVKVVHSIHNVKAITVSVGG
jgi:hypothetical protein